MWLHRARKLAVDIPSGLDGDTGVPLGETIHADLIVTFVALKSGFAKPGSSDSWLGKVHVVPISLPRRLLESKHIRFDMGKHAGVNLDLPAAG